MHFVGRLVYLHCTHLIREVFGMWRGEAYPHIRIDEGYSVQQVCKAKTSMSCAVHGLEASAELRADLRTAELLLRQVPVAVHILAEQGDLLHSLHTNTHLNTHMKLIWCIL